MPVAVTAIGEAPVAARLVCAACRRSWSLIRPSMPASGLCAARRSGRGARTRSRSTGSWNAEPVPDPAGHRAGGRSRVRPERSSIEGRGRNSGLRWGGRGGKTPSPTPGTAAPVRAHRANSNRAATQSSRCARASHEVLWSPPDRLPTDKPGKWRTAMLISGVIVSAGAVAVLARRLQRAGERRLADDVGLALDADWVEFTLAAHEEKTILSVLRDCPDLLQPLRDALQSTARRRAEGPI